MKVLVGEAEGVAVRDGVAVIEAVGVEVEVKVAVGVGGVGVIVGVTVRVTVGVGVGSTTRPVSRKAKNTRVAPIPINKASKPKATGKDRVISGIRLP